MVSVELWRKCKKYILGNNRLENELIRLVYSKYNKLINNSPLIENIKLSFEFIFLRIDNKLMNK